MMSLLTFALFTAVGLETGNASWHLEITSIALILTTSTWQLFWQKSIRMSFSGPRSHSGMRNVSGVVRVLVSYAFVFHANVALVELVFVICCK